MLSHLLLHVTVAYMEGCCSVNGQLFRQLGCKCYAHLSVLLSKHCFAGCAVVASCVAAVVQYGVHSLAACCMLLTRLLQSLWTSVFRLTLAVFGTGANVGGGQL